MSIDTSEEITLADPYQVAASKFFSAVCSGVDGKFYELAAEGLLVKVDAEIVNAEIELGVQD